MNKTTDNITLLRGESKEKTDEMERKYNIDPDIIPEKTCDTRLYSGDWSVPTPLTIDRDWLYGTTHEIICIFGSWHVTKEGDLIYVGTKDKVNWYPIWSEQLTNANKNDDWVLHLTGKAWFDDQCYEDFKRALFVACKIAGAPQYIQIRDYSERAERHQGKQQSRIAAKKAEAKTDLMHDSNTGYTKIGKSDNPRRRERTLQSEKPTITLFRVCDRNVEDELHAKYASKRVRGEWFDLTEADIEAICNDYQFKEI